MKTVRQQIMDLLRGREMSAQDLSRAIGVKEREVERHLPHVAASASGRGERLVISPSRCLDCGYVFRERRRVTRPGRCPVCQGRRLEKPAFEIRSD